MSLLIFIALAFITGWLVGTFFGLAYTATKRWVRSRRKFTCSVCKVRKRMNKGYSPLSLDLEYGSDLVVPLNLMLCHNCVGEPPRA